MRGSDSSTHGHCQESAFVDSFDEFGLLWTPERPDLQRSGCLRFDHRSLGLGMSVLNPFDDAMEFYVKSQSPLTT